MIELKKDRKSPTWIITTTDSEGYHRQINLTEQQLNKLTELWKKQKQTETSQTEK